MCTSCVGDLLVKRNVKMHGYTRPISEYLNRRYGTLFLLWIVAFCWRRREARNEGLVSVMGRDWDGFFLRRSL